MHLLLRPSLFIPRNVFAYSSTLLYRANQQPPCHSPFGVNAPPSLDVEHARKLVLRAVLWTSQPEMGVQQTGATAKQRYVGIHRERAGNDARGTRTWVGAGGRKVRQARWKALRHNITTAATAVRLT